MFKSEFGIREIVRINLWTTENKVGLRDKSCDDVKLIKVDMSHIYLGIRSCISSQVVLKKFVLFSE
jgi:hypothetical protein